MTHLRPKHLLLIAISIALAIAAWMFTPPSGLEPVGGSWFVRPESTFVIEAGPRFVSLYRRRARRYIAVDGRIEDYRFYEPDCVVYSAVKKYRGPIFAVCGDRTPIGIMESSINWSLENDGLVQAQGRQLAGTNEIARHTRIKPIAGIIALAMRQPLYDRRWQSRDPVTHGNNVIPSVEAPGSPIR